jgi:hypothetical protein
MLVPTPPHSLRRLVFAFFATLAMVAQIAVALAPLAEGRERSWAPHVEADGVTQHYAHNETACAACQARSIQSAASRPTAPLFHDAGIAAAPPQRDLDEVFSESLPQDNPRAPPTLI